MNNLSYSLGKFYEPPSDTFYLPPDEKRKNVKVGDRVKLLFHPKFGQRKRNTTHISGERLWVKIRKISKNGFVGVLDNDPYIIKNLNCGDTVKFNWYHIIDIYDNDYTNNPMVKQYLLAMKLFGRDMLG